MFWTYLHFFEVDYRVALLETLYFNYRKTSLIKNSHRETSYMRGGGLNEAFL